METRGGFLLPKNANGRIALCGDRKPGRKARKLVSRIGKYATVIFALIALFVSVIVPLTAPKAFSAPDCHNAEVKDYAEGIALVVNEIGDLKSEYNNYVWDMAIMRDIDRDIKMNLKLTDEQLRQVFGEDATARESSYLPESAKDENGEYPYSGPGVLHFGADRASKYDREAMTKIINGKVAEFLAKNPRQICGNRTMTKPGCTRIDARDYSDKIAQAVEKIGKSWDGRDYFWDWKVLPDIVPGIEKELELEPGDINKVFGEKSWGLLHGPPTVGPEAKKERTEPKWVKHILTQIADATKYDRAAMTKIITDEVADFLDEHPRENCASGTDTKPVEPTKPGTDTKPGDTTKPGTTEPATPGTDAKTGKDDPTLEPNMPGDTTKPDTDTKPDTKPADAGKDGSGLDVDNNKPGADTSTVSDNQPEGEAATTTGEDNQTVLEKPAETGQLATTGAVALTALGVSVLLVGAGVGLAVYRRKKASKNV